MKDNLNIEELFKDKFSSFEGDVSPDMWANIQQGMAAGTSTAAASVGMSLLMKTILISGGIVAATFGGVYLFSDNDVVEPAIDSNIVVEDNSNLLPDNETTLNTDIVQIEDTNPVSEHDSEVTDPLQEENVVGGNTHDNDQSGDNNEGVDVADNSTDTNTTDDTNSTESGDQQTGDETLTDNGHSADVVDNSGDNKEEIQDAPYGKISFKAGDEYAPSTYTFYANAENYSAVSWEFEDGTILEGTDVEYTFEKPGSYVVRMIVLGNGKVHEAVEIVIETKSNIGNAVNIFTPDGDGFNDLFFIDMVGIETFAIFIMDKNEAVVFESSDPEFKWDGTNKGGGELEKGEYTYIIYAKGFDGKEFGDRRSLRIE